MENAEKKIRNYIRPGKAVRVTLWIALVLTVALVLAGIVFHSVKDRAEAQKFDAMHSEKEVFSYIDVVGVSNWLYEYTYNDNRMTFYAVIDGEGYMSFATINPSDYRNMSEQRRYWNGDTDTMPEPYRITGEAWPLNPATKTWTSLYQVSGAESAEEFENNFGKMYLSCGYNPLEETGWGFYTGAIFAGLFLAIMVMCCAPQWIKLARSLRALKKSDQTDAAAEELEQGTAIGNCTITENYLFVSRQSIAIQLDSVKKCVAYEKSARLDTETLGQIVITDMRPEAVDRLLEALPLENEAIPSVRIKSR